MDRRSAFLKKHLKENLEQSISIEEISKLVNLSPTYLRHLFKTETGLTITQYLRDLRLEKAHMLLTETFLSVKEIGSSVGIPHQSKFCQYFTEKYGVTPTEYQKE